VSSNPNVADSASAQILLNVTQPFANHNGGQLAFGPDRFSTWASATAATAAIRETARRISACCSGKSYESTWTADRRTRSRRRTRSATRRAPCPRSGRTASATPWRFSFDRLTGDLFIADVGQSAREEVNFQPAASLGGQNYGWRRMEGTACFNPSTACNDGTLTLPILEYDHSLGCSITGGYRYRGRRFPQYASRFFYGDFCSGRIWAATQSGQTWSSTQLMDTAFSITSFGEDEAGELYVVHYGSGSDGTVQRLVETSQSFALTVSAPAPGPGRWRPRPRGSAVGPHALRRSARARL
jgi:hypothetical protein